MRKLKMLILTDHSNHTIQNSLYPLAKAMMAHPFCEHVDVATRGNSSNDSFFKAQQTYPLFVSRVDDDFSFHEDGKSFRSPVRTSLLKNYDVVWFRMPPPLSDDFLHFLILKYPNQLFINAPIGIKRTGSKDFLINFPDLCPPMKICRSAADITAFASDFPIVLKPFREYGGKGIVRIDGDKVMKGSKETTLSEFLSSLEGNPIAYIGVKFLEKVSEGDKRIVVVDGQIMGASLRLPVKDFWICNIAMGGSHNHAEVDEEEIRIVKRLHPTLARLGVVMYGIDTLMGDDGKRVLSEINTTSIGGLPQIAKQRDEPLVEKAADLIWNYIVTKKTKHVSTNG
jgi:glutathione synthase